MRRFYYTLRRVAIVVATLVLLGPVAFMLAFDLHRAPGGLREDMPAPGYHECGIEHDTVASVSRVYVCHDGQSTPFAVYTYDAP
jgi:hypothetical protein